MSAVLFTYEQCATYAHTGNLSTLNSIYVGWWYLNAHNANIKRTLLFFVQILLFTSVKYYLCACKTISYSAFCPHSTIFCTRSVMYICTTRYLCKAIYHIVSEISCGFSFFPYFQITFPSAIPDFNFFSQNISNKTISSENQVLLENLEI